MTINKKTYKILNTLIVAVFLFVVIIYSIFSYNKKIDTVSYNKVYSIHKTVEGYLLGVEGLYFEHRENELKNLIEVTNPIKAFKDLKQTLWLDVILLSIKNNYSSQGICFFEHSYTNNVINVYKNKDDGTEMYPSIKLILQYNESQKSQVEECMAFINELIIEVNNKVKTLIINEISGHAYFLEINSLIDTLKNENKINYQETLKLIQSEINRKSSMYKDIKAFELKEAEKSYQKREYSKYKNILVFTFLTIFLLGLIQILYRLKINFLDYFK